MRKVFYRGVMVVAVSLVVSAAAFGIPREGRERTRDRENTVVKFVKRVVRTLGDGLTVPTPAPKPAPKP
jgi:hypothetical protein